MTAREADAPGEAVPGSYTLDTKLSGALGGRTAQALERAFGHRTVGDLLAPLPAPLRAARRAHRAREPPARRERHDRRRGARSAACATCASAAARSSRRRSPTAPASSPSPSSTRRGASTTSGPGARGIFAGKVGDYKGARQLAHPDYELFDDRSTLGAERRRRAALGRGADPDLPGHVDARELADREVDRAPARRARRRSTTRSRIEVRGRARPARAARCARGACTAPRREADWKAARRHAALHRGVRAADRAARATRRAARRTTRSPAGPARAACSNGSTPPCRSRSPATSVDVGARDRRRPRAARADEPPRAGRGRLGQDARRAARDARGRRLGRAVGAARADRGARGAAPALDRPHARPRPRRPSSCRPSSPASCPRPSARRRCCAPPRASRASSSARTRCSATRSSFADLGLVVVDEQHRFGVEQREALRLKGAEPPHVLVLTATPIPRTVAMTVFGDLDISTIARAARRAAPIESHVVPLAEHPGWRPRVWERLAEELAQGRQGFVVCPAIERQGRRGRRRGARWRRGRCRAAPAASVAVGARRARRAPALRRPPHRAAARPHERRREGRRRCAPSPPASIDVLVATTVIEVGVDVPNACAMVVLDADRFGVSQLHQLRGRVGRGSVPGLCLLVTARRAGHARARAGRGGRRDARRLRARPGRPRAAPGGRRARRRPSRAGGRR